MGVVAKDGTLKDENLNHCHMSKVVDEVYGEKIVKSLPEPQKNGQFEKTLQEFCMLLRLCSFTKAFQEPEAEAKEDMGGDAPPISEELGAFFSALEIAKSGRKVERDTAWKVFDPNGVGHVTYDELSSAVKSWLKGTNKGDECFARYKTCFAHAFDEAKDKTKFADTPKGEH